MKVKKVKNDDKDDMKGSWEYKQRDFDERNLETQGNEYVDRRGRKAKV